VRQADYSVPALASLLQMKPNRLQPERRSGVRIVTLKNAAWLALALVVLFVAYTEYVEHRRGNGDYGRLYNDRRR
jgi:hypothetical protein